MKTDETPAAKAPGGGFARDTFALVVLTAVTLACLCPFLGKAFHIDDPLFIWCGKHIVSEPGNFYHFTVNWSGKTEPMAQVTQNPPLASYYLALVGMLLGWGEISLHVGFLLWALAAIWGTYLLARRFCAHPLAAALVTVTAPVFLVSGTSVMCDTMMLALWVWALVFWTGGLASDGALKLCLGAVLMAACGLTKYFGFALVPLALVYAVMERRKFGRWLACLLVPIAVMVLYELLTRKLYGRGSLFDAFNYAQNQGAGGDLVSKILTVLSFSGGSVIILLLAPPLLWGWRGFIGACVVAILLGAYFVARKMAGHVSTLDSGSVRWLLVIQAAIFATAGLVLIILATVDLLEQRSAESVLLFFWMAGTFAFVCVACWQVSARYLLPMLPAAAILLVRRLEFRQRLDTGKLIGPLRAPLGFSLIIALMVTWADASLADTARTAAFSIQQKAGATAHTVWFEGHWGFQYYMEKQGAKAVDFWHMPFAAGDAVVLPTDNSRVYKPPKDGLEPWFEYEGVTVKWLTTMNQSCGAGFYSDDWGPLPYAFGRVPPEKYVVLRMK
jgi:4-amino-4-deoxy-L-arabinose transferase-like glycosyltransferase